MGSQKKLFLLDAYALIYRAHFAFTKNPRINSKGHNTSVPFGFTNTLMEVLQKQKPSHIAVVFDTAAPTFRDQIYKEYKATRQETPEDVRFGTPKVKEIIRGFKIPVIEYDGFEADDIIGTLSGKAAMKGYTVYMMTPDKDFGQLVSDKVLLYKPAYMGNAVDVMSTAEVCEKWDIEKVSQVTDMLGLQGDSSDNIPGIPGIGPKTAAALIHQFGSVENVVKNAASLKGKQKELVEKYGDQAILSKKLATIVTDVPVEFNEEELEYKEPDEGVLRPLFDELEFRSFLNRLFSEQAPPRQVASQLSMFDRGPAAAPPKATSKLDYTNVQTPREMAALADRLGQCKQFSVEVFPDAENSGQVPIAIGVGEGQAFHLMIRSKDDMASLQKAFENEKVAKVGHNLKAVILAMKTLGIELRGRLFDTLITHYLIEPEAGHDLEVLSRQYLGILPREEGDDYLLRCERADYSLRLRAPLEKELFERGHRKLMEDVEMPLVQVLAAMEFEGVRVDEQMLADLSEQLRKESEKLQKKIFKQAGEEFNINSPKQLGEILFEKLKLTDKAKKTRTGQYATGEEVLLKLAPDNPIAASILDFRLNEKLRSTYVDALPKMISPRDGRIHTDYRQAVAATGRLSSMSPNLQNIPVRNERGREIRKAFVPRSKGFLFMSADYSQIELRIAASFADDKTMIDAFRSERDIHATTAARVFKVNLDQVTPDMRRKAKSVNFGILYGSTIFGISQNLNIPRSEAAEIIDAYFREFPAIKDYMDASIEKARKTMFVETILGRRRYLRDINSRNITTRGFAERNAINAPIQGSAADIIKMAMVSIYEWMAKEKLKSKMILQVHDELVFDLHESEKEVVPDKVRELMIGAVNLKVPMDVEVGIGNNWLEAH